MCGIVALIGYDPRGPGSSPRPALPARMTAALRHRGPDDEGFFTDGEVALGVRRLAIIDPAGGRQPWVRPEGALVFNGEVYDHPRLARELDRAGEHRRTTSDVEVLAAWLAREGDAALTRFDGMFALAWWDRRARRLLAARDRLGQKPLYYCQHGRRLAIASEIKALRELPDFDATLDPHALRDYHQLGYVPAPRTIYRRVRKLRPGWRLEWHDGRVTTAPYWRWDFTRHAPPAALSARRAELAARLDATIRAHLVSDAPLGVSLSGGLDSATVLYFAARHHAAPLTAYTVDFPGAPAFSEGRAAAAVARALGARHEVIAAGPELLDHAEALIDGMDEPHANSSDLPQYLVARHAAREVKVLLSGTGGDELFAGYPRHWGYAWLGRTGFVPPELARAGARLVRALPAAPGGGPSRRRAAGLLEGMSHRGGRAYERFTARLGGPGDGGPLCPEVARAWDWEEGWRERRRCFDALEVADERDRPLAFDLQAALPDDLLITTDRASMAASVEVRLPLLDHRLAAWALSLPFEMRLRGLRPKHLLRETMRDRLPHAALSPRKMGFSVPLGAWLCGPAADRLRHELAPAAVAARGWHRPAAVTRMIEEHVAGRRDWTFALWGLLVLERWCRRHIGG